MEAKYAAMPPTREQLRGREIIDKLSSGAPLTSIKPNDKVSTGFDLQRFGTYEEKKIFAHHDFETGIKRITKTKIIETPFAITELVNQKGGVTRNFYDENGRQYLQISNNDHGNIAESNYGEHAHDYVLSPEGKTISRTSRELYDFERERNSDIL